MRAASRPEVSVPMLLALVAAAWLCLVLWDASPYARYMHHVDWADVSPLVTLCRVVPVGGVIVPAALFSLAWLLMIAAMMLPTTFPLLVAFRKMTAHYPDRALLLTCLILGYALAWLAFGVAIDVVDTGFHAAAARSGWLSVHGWIVGATVLALAGLYQFSRLKYVCLERCRSPLSFIMEHWSGVDAPRDSVRLGIHHGIFCVGCCWSLMVVMFVVGAGSIAWMLGLAALMGVEKNFRWGPMLARPLGGALLAGAAAIVSTHTIWVAA